MTTMFMPFSFYSPERQAEIQRRQAQAVEHRTKLAVPFDPKMKWEVELNLHAAGYQLMPSLFAVEPTRHVAVDAAIAAGDAVISPDGKWAYTESILPAGGVLSTVLSKRRGTVLFDGEIAIPRLHRRRGHGDQSWRGDPWMSLTPMEHFSLRGGVRAARGAVVVGGLGMGYQLAQIARKKSVQTVRCIEVCEELASWVWPRVMEMLDEKSRAKCELVVGDLNKVAPTLEGDVLVADIWPSYGGNAMRDRDTRGFGRVWCWGSQYCC